MTSDDIPLVEGWCGHAIFFFFEKPISDSFFLIVFQGWGDGEEMKGLATSWKGVFTIMVVKEFSLWCMNGQFILLPQVRAIKTSWHGSFSAAAQQAELCGHWEAGKALITPESSDVHFSGKIQRKGTRHNRFLHTSLSVNPDFSEVTQQAGFWIWEDTAPQPQVVSHCVPLGFSRGCRLTASVACESNAARMSSSNDPISQKVLSSENVCVSNAHLPLNTSWTGLISVSSVLWKLSRFGFSVDTQ